MSTSVQPIVIWQQAENCPYSNLFFSGLLSITSKNNARSMSMTAGPSSSSPIEVDSRISSQRGHARNTSLPHRKQTPQSAIPRMEADDFHKNEPVRRPSSSRSTASRRSEVRNESWKRHLSDDRKDALTFSPEESYTREVDSDRDSLSSEYTERNASPLTSFLSFNASPTESSVSLVSKRERRASVQTVPLPPRSSRESKRRSVMSVADLYPSGAESSSEQSPRLHPLEHMKDVGGWGEELYHDWRQGSDSLFPDDRSFLITS